MPNYYNIALIPVLAPINEAFVEQALAIEPYCKGYQLGKEALPHITLCQFTTEDDPPFDDIWESVKTLTAPSTVSITELAVREGLNKNSGFDWIEWRVDQDPALLSLQQSVFDILAANERYLIPLTAPDLYSPHLTLGRVAEGSVFTTDLNLMTPPPFETVLAMGASSPNGEWRQTLLSL